jgi:hypothetical protein
MIPTDGEFEQGMEGPDPGDVGRGLGEEFSGCVESIMIAKRHDDPCLH